MKPTFISTVFFVMGAVILILSQWLPDRTYYAVSAVFFVVVAIGFGE